MVNFVENPAKSVLCVGHISQSRYAPFVETPPYTEYFDEAMFPQSDDDQLTENRLLCNVLKSVHTVLFDHTGVDPFVEAILNRASRQNKRLLDLNDLCLMK